MIKARFGDRIDHWIHVAFPFLFWRRLDPNLLTVIGTGVSAVAAACLATGHLLVGGLLILAGGFFDLVDGVVARHFQSSTPFGAFLDSTMDRLVDMLILFGLIIYFSASGRVGIVMLTGVVLVGSVMTSYAKARAELFVPHLDGGMFERGERIGLIALGAILGIMVPVLWLLAIGTSVTVVQRFAGAYRALARIELASPEPGSAASAVNPSPGRAP